jgi:hypothetical protein
MPREVKIRKEGKKVYLVSPFHPDFPGEAHKVAGRWNESEWSFDFRHEDRVREICRSIYGTDGDDNPKIVTVRATRAALGGKEKSWFLAGYLVARVYSSEQAPTIGDGVSVIKGEITVTGSRKYYGLVGTPSLVIEMLDIPELAAKKAVAESPPGSVEIIEPITPLQRASEMMCPDSHALIRSDAALYDALTQGDSRITRDADGTPLVETRHCNKCGSDIGRVVSEEAARRLDDIPEHSKPRERSA